MAEKYKLKVRLAATPLTHYGDLPILPLELLVHSSLAEFRGHRVPSTDYLIGYVTFTIRFKHRLMTAVAAQMQCECIYSTVSDTLTGSSYLG